MFRSMRWALLALLLAIVLLASASGVLGAERKGGAPRRTDLNVGDGVAISTRTTSQHHPRIAYGSGANAYLVVWEDVWSASDTDIRGQVVAAEGTVLGDMGIDTSSVVDIHPDVAYDPTDNEYLVVWERVKADGDHDILAQRVDGATGEITGAEITVAASQYYESYPAVDYNPTRGEFLIVFERRTGTGEFYHTAIYGQRVHPAGTTLGNPFAIAPDAGPDGLDRYRPAVAYGITPAAYLVTWQGYQSVAGDFGIYGRMVAGDGTLLGSTIGVCTSEGDQLTPRTAYDFDANTFLVVWEDHHYAPSNGSFIDAQRVDASGNLLGSAITVSGPDAHDRQSPAVAYKSAVGSWIVAWEYAYSASDHDVYSRRVAYDGSHPDAEMGVSELGTGEITPAVAAGSGATLLMVWDDGRNLAANGTDIYGALLTPTVPRLSGHVYVGQKGDTGHPLGGVSVRLYCSSGAGTQGSLIGATVTNARGAYGLPVYGRCEFYNLIETDPEGYVSVGADPGGGVFLGSNWIYYADPLAGKTLTDNNFWDELQGSSDTIPPDNWGNFTPAAWVNTQTVTCSVRVEDGGSGLQVGTAEYQFSRQGQWSTWASAAATGEDRTISAQTVTASGIRFGQDSGPNVDETQVRFRISDMAGNRGTSDAYKVKIDTVPPLTPTSLTCPSHPVATWISNTTVTCQWSGASDTAGTANSGIAGYAIKWDHQPATLPDLTFPTAATQIATPLADGNDWYLHVRSVDLAGNGSLGADHYGPVYVDTGAPTAWFTAPAPGPRNTATYTVSWTASDLLSGIVAYDVQTSPDGATWTTKLAASPQTSALYTGYRGQPTYFRVRARDGAGNVGGWSDALQVYTGVDVTVRVEDESGTPLGGADVYLNNTWQGQTPSAGEMAVHNALLGDRVVARYLVDQHPASKSGHDWLYPGNWAYRTYLTSFGFDGSGNPQIYTIVNTGIKQTLQVWRSRTLIGMNVVASVQWDANSDFLSDLEAGFRTASNYLYDLTDGQMMLEMTTILDSAVHWSDADFRILPMNNYRANADRGGIAQGSLAVARFGRGWNSPAPNQHTWEEGGFRTLMHEFGHYGLWFGDEYFNANGVEDATAGCTLDYTTTTPTEAACLMAFAEGATELCSGLSLHPHNPDTMQQTTNGGPCWNTLRERYKDQQGSPGRWQIIRPDDRGNIMPGPTAIPVGDWVQTRVVDVSTGACPPYDVYVTASPTLKQTWGADVWVMGSQWLQEGVTYTSTGTTSSIALYGVHNGDTIRMWNACGPGCDWTSFSTAQCTGSSGLHARLDLRPTPDPFTLDVAGQVAGDAATLTVRVSASVRLAGPPQVRVLQDGASDPASVSLTWDGSAYAGSLTLDPNMGLRGVIWVEATDTGGHTLDRLTPFLAVRVTANTMTRLQSDDGLVQMFLAAASLPNGAVVSIQPARIISATGLSWVGKAYSVDASSGALSGSAALNVSYDPALLGGLNPANLRLYRWDSGAGRWVFVGGAVDLARHAVGAEVTTLGTFALMAEVSQERHMFLPIVFKGG
jgi:hypothetical protein